MTDFNPIAHKPAGFDLLIAQGINDHSVIAGQVFDPARGTSYAYSAAPCANTLVANQNSGHSGPLATRNPAAKVTLPAAVRAQLLTQARFGLLGGL